MSFVWIEVKPGVLNFIINIIYKKNYFYLSLEG